jgi:CxxC motif-containing protein
MEEKRRFVCVTCPVGCSIEATVRDGVPLEISGARCKRGAEFVREELAAPKRMLTTTVRVRGGVLPLVPVRSVAPLPKGRLLEAAARLREVVLDAPVAEHQVVYANVLDTGVDIITSRALASAATRDSAEKLGEHGGSPLT